MNIHECGGVGGGLDLEIISDRMNHEGHQLSCFCNFYFSFHYWLNFILCLRDGRRHHEPDEVRQEHHV